MCHPLCRAGYLSQTKLRKKKGGKDGRDEPSKVEAFCGTGGGRTGGGEGGAEGAAQTGTDRGGDQPRPLFELGPLRTTPFLRKHRPCTIPT